ncbi:hypothetical protein LMG32289_02630 [Cupriavidus pampae]|uniref:Uncharacterized protein n=1 Tax=Cupriavidus pampae TaxID=659251 RepID=A0ABN7YGR8_9BURK|nr:hypothetical protein LMG32289_02630 [Cupriavidus pampae]
MQGKDGVVTDDLRNGIVNTPRNRQIHNVAALNKCGLHTLPARA